VIDYSFVERARKELGSGGCLMPQCRVGQRYSRAPNFSAMQSHKEASIHG
jgi:hypothetical protein